MFSMAKFRMKPVVVEAKQFDEEFFLKYAGTAYRTGLHFFLDHLIVRSPRGEIRAELGDWIVTGVEGGEIGLQAGYLRGRLRTCQATARDI